jgi:hypothetical protein
VPQWPSTCPSTARLVSDFHAPIAPAFLAGLVILYLALAIITGKGMFWRFPISISI